MNTKLLAEFHSNELRSRELPREALRKISHIHIQKKKGKKIKEYSLLTTIFNKSQQIQNIAKKKRKEEFKNQNPKPTAIKPEDIEARNPIERGKDTCCIKSLKFSEMPNQKT